MNISEEVYNSLKWETIEDAKKLPDMIKGSVVIGCEPVDYPLTDGLDLHLKRPDGSYIILGLEGAVYPEDDEETDFRITVAKVEGVDE